MHVAFHFQFNEQTTLELLQVLARHNARLMAQHPGFPLLYRSGVVYRREPTEEWLDAGQVIDRGEGDCEDLASWRAAELVARGWKALRPGDGGYALAKRLQLDTLEAHPFLRTRQLPGKRKLYHCVTRYRVGPHWYRDDPSARLGMYGPHRTSNPWGDRPETAAASTSQLSLDPGGPAAG